MDQNTASPQTNSAPATPGIPLPTRTSSSHDGWELETLIKKALKRTGDRILSFIIVYVIGIVAFLGIFVAIGIVGAILVGVLAALNQPILMMIIGIPVSIGGIFLMMYLGSWYQLAATYIVVADEKPTMSVAFKATKPMIFGFIWLGAINSLFFLGLLPISFLSLFMIMIVWMVWSSFTTFVFLEFKKKGLANLWMSKALVSQKFWGIFLRSFVITVGYLLLAGGLAYVGKSTEISGLISVIRTILSVFFSVFILGFNYEMYRLTKRDIEVKTPKVWLGISIISLVLMVVLSFASIGALVSKSGEIMKQIQKEMPAFQKSIQRSQELQKTGTVNIDQEVNDVIQQQEQMMQTTPTQDQQKLIKGMMGSIAPMLTKTPARVK